jgi:L-ascorbate metabolism protein UlaG (beta-lactamase superfamily)
MLVRALFNSGFLVELSRCILLFDYYRGALPPFPDKDIFVFVSHRHPDHYNRAVWELEKQYPNVYYVLYQDVTERRRGNVLRVSCRQNYRFQELEIETLASTDQGCAFLVTAEGKQLYHAGDLNWWHWEGEPDAQNQWQEENFKREITRLKGRHLDCAFLPLDPRLGDSAWWGFLEVLKTCRIDAVFPMHYFHDRAGMLSYLELPQLQPYRNIIFTEPVVTI